MKIKALNLLNAHELIQFPRCTGRPRWTLGYSLNSFGSYWEIYAEDNYVGLFDFQEADLILKFSLRALLLSSNLKKLKKTI